MRVNDPHESESRVNPRDSMLRYRASHVVSRKRGWECDITLSESEKIRKLIKSIGPFKLFKNLVFKADFRFWINILSVVNLWEGMFFRKRLLVLLWIGKNAMKSVTAVAKILHWGIVYSLLNYIKHHWKEYSTSFPKKVCEGNGIVSVQEKSARNEGKGKRVRQTKETPPFNPRHLT